jgi:transposase-like protein
MGKRYSKEVREEVIGKVRSGQKVSDVGKAYGIKEMTIRGWLVRDTGSSAAETLEVSRFRRANEALLRIIEQLTYRAEVRGRNHRRGSHWEGHQEQPRPRAWCQSLQSVLPPHKARERRGTVAGDRSTDAQASWLWVSANCHSPWY